MEGVSRVLVTGDAGFIGSHLVDRLLTEGFEVTILDNFSTRRIQNIESHRDREEFHFVRGDVTNVDLVRRVVDRVDAVLHEAALVDMELSTKDPLLFHKVNVLGTLNLLSACLNSDARRFILAYSASVYGDSKSTKKREDMLAQPVSPYGVSKLAAEHYIRVFSKLYGLHTVCLRYFNVYGPRQGAGSGHTGVIAAFINQLLKGEPPIVYGDGAQTRDFVHVDDVVSANILALETGNAAGEVFNIGSGSAISVCEIAKMLQKITHMEHLECEFMESRAGEIKHCSANITEAKNLLGFHPKTRIHDGLSKLVKWHLEPLKAAK